MCVCECEKERHRALNAGVFPDGPIRSGASVSNLLTDSPTVTPQNLSAPLLFVTHSAVTTNVGTSPAGSPPVLA